MRQSAMREIEPRVLGAIGFLFVAQVQARGTAGVVDARLRVLCRRRLEGELHLDLLDAERRVGGRRELAGRGTATRGEIIEGKGRATTARSGQEVAILDGAEIGLAAQATVRGVVGVSHVSARKLERQGGGSRRRARLYHDRCA